jgi:hypothetical protein
MYKIIRSYRDSYTKRTVATVMTLEEARAHCNDPETASDTCTNAAGRARTKRCGPWFDGYETIKTKPYKGHGIFAALREMHPDRSVNE